MLSKAFEPTPHPNQSLLSKLIEDDIDYLEKTIRIYVSKTMKQLESELGHKIGQSLDSLTQEILNQTIETVLRKAEDFNPDLSHRPWVSKFAANVIRGWKRDQKRKYRKVINIADLPQAKLGEYSDEDILGLLNQASKSLNNESQMVLEDLLSLVNDKDRKVLKLAFIDDLDGKALAAALGISEGTAYQRKSRAIARLKKAYLQQEGGE